ncbi:hypothetical protein [Dactylosporangium sp. NPDC000521]|uniref:hypothetical protein n=1 Tax=Dactylosporangium sp. NPDC000521 TaxID=3363975 RepID=UPI0036C860CB
MFEDYVVQFLQLVSHCIGYKYDDLDEAALTRALEDTDDESTDRWFSYPWPACRRSWFISPRPPAEVRSAFAWKATSTPFWRPVSKFCSTCCSNTGAESLDAGCPAPDR